MEIDLLTGATSILRTDIIYDCGQSLNPAVDLGQVSLTSLLVTNPALVCFFFLKKKNFFSI
ncbi:molybdopterin cofactor-binding domain-containing protein, partial [Mycobacterium kansasii]